MSFNQTASVLDREGALSRLEGDEELYREVANVFLDDTPSQLLLLEQAIKDASNEVAKRYAHSLKSAAANIGAEHLRSVAAQMEAAAAKGGAAGAAPYLASVLEEFERVKQALLQLK